MNALDRLIPAPRLFETDHVDLAGSPEKVREIVRHYDFARAKLVHALFVARSLPALLTGHVPDPISLRIDDVVSSTTRPGFQVLADDPDALTVGAIGKVWQSPIPFVHVGSAEAFTAFSEPGFVKVAWAIRFAPLGENDTRVTFELRVETTDEASWLLFKDYFRVIGPGSHFVRQSILSTLAKELGTPESKEDERPLEGDDLLPDAGGQATDAITIAAPPESVWMWLVQMGCGRGGFYSVDALDNGGTRSAREIHPELQALREGDMIPAKPGSTEGFEVLRIEPQRALVLGGLYDREKKQQLPFASERPAKYWQVTWAFCLEPMGDGGTRLRVRGRAAFPEGDALHAAWMTHVHRFMQRAQLRHLAARAEGRLPHDDWRDVSSGIGGAAIAAAALLTPFLRDARNHWGLDPETAERSLPGDLLVSAPRWGWTHGIEIDAPTTEVWPWIAQIGADRGGFYSYQWLENLAGCRLQNAEAIHDAWQLQEGGELILHPDAPPLRIAAMESGRWFVAHGPPDLAARSAGKPWVEVSWLFLVEPLPGNRSRFISRYRCGSSDDLGERIKFGPTLLEPIGFAMDRRMLMGVKERCERRRA